MAFAEKRAWIMLVVSTIGYGAYVVIVFLRSDGPLVQTPYVAPMLGAIAASIAASIVAGIAVGITTPKGEEKPDQRDREIDRLGDYIGQSFVVIGGLAALLLAMVEAEYFWIANAVYLCFFLSAVTGATAKIFAYRKGFDSW